MNTVDKIKGLFKGQKLVMQLMYVLIFLSVVVLLKMTWNVWATIGGYITVSLTPFIIGFIAAYILNPLVEFLNKKGLNRGLAIALIIIATLLILFTVLINLFPMLYQEFTNFLNSIGSSIEFITEWYTKTSNEPNSVVSSIIHQLATSFSGIENTILDFVRVFITNFVSASMNFLTTLLFSTTIAIYMLSDFQKFKDDMKKLVGRINWKLPYFLTEIDNEMGVYVHSTLILMLVYFIEYTTIYYIMGHKGFLMIGLLYVVVGTLVPYVGGMIVTAIGLLTGLGMPAINLVILIILVMILSQVDGYVTSPLIYKKGVKIEPLVSLLLVFIGSAVFGFAGVMLAMPVYIALRSVNKVNKELNLKGNEVEISEEVI